MNLFANYGASPTASLDDLSWSDSKDESLTDPVVESDTCVIQAQYVKKLITTLEHARKEQKDANEKQLVSLRQWFIRAPWTIKYQFLINLLRENKNNHSFLKFLLCFIADGISKDIIYSTNQRNGVFSYDCIPLDCDRTLDLDALGDAQTVAHDWFISLEVPNQVDVMVELIVIAGGGMLRLIHSEADRLAKERLRADKLLRTLGDKGQLERIAKRMQANTTKQLYAISVDRLEVAANSMQQEDEQNGVVAASNAAKKPKKKKAGVEKMPKEDVEERAEQTPEEKEGKTWDTVFEKMRLELGVDEHGLTYPHPKVNVTKNKVKGKKTKEKGKKGEKKGGDVEMDWIQLLPIHVNRKIISLLGEKDRRNLKKVNRYWSNMVADVNAELTARKFIDSTILKTKKSVAKMCADLKMADNVDLELSEEPQLEPQHVDGCMQRLAALRRHCCGKPSLLATRKCGQITTRMFTELYHEQPQRFPGMTQDLSFFPRPTGSEKKSERGRRLTFKEETGVAVMEREGSDITMWEKPL